MAKEEKEYTKFEESKEAIALPAPKQKTEHKVRKEFTLDKLYMPGSKILLEDGKIKETLISNKFI